MKKINFGLIFQIIQIIAIGYLAFKAFQPTGISNRLDKIEQSQKEIKANQATIMENSNRNFAAYDSTNKVHIKQIESLTISIDNSIKQVRKTNTIVNGWASIFKENKVELPDPDK